MEQKEIPYGYCQCGCGQKTGVTSQATTKKGYQKGQPYRFVHGHNNRGVVGEKASQWKGGQYQRRDGYRFIMQPDHPRAAHKGHVLEHLIVAEKALGKSLPVGAEVHHVNEIKSDNRNNNLVICQDTAYHQLLHQRLDAYKACGNPNWRRCRVCKQYGDPSSETFNVVHSYHKKCIAEESRAKRARLKEV